MQFKPVSGFVLLASLAAGNPACTVDDDSASLSNATSAVSWGSLPAPGPTTVDTPIGLALDIEDGVAQPLQVRERQRFYVNQIDLRAHIDTAVDEGVAGLDSAGDFAELDWHGTERVDESFVSTPNADGTWTRRRFYRRSRWMDEASFFILLQLDDHGHPRGIPIVVDTGLEHARTNTDRFFARRMRAIQWTDDCASTTDCSTAHSFQEEALVELRYANGPNPSFPGRPKHHPAEGVVERPAASGTKSYTFPVTQVAHPTWDYGFQIDLAVQTPPSLPDQVYAPGQQLTVQFTLRDGSGKALHPPGQLPTFAGLLVGQRPAGHRLLEHQREDDGRTTAASTKRSRCSSRSTGRCRTRRWCTIRSIYSARSSGRPTARS